MAVFSGNGSAASPSFTFSADTNTGIYRPNPDEVSIATGGTDRVVFGDLVDLPGGGTSSLVQFQNTRIGLNVATATSASAAPVDFRADVGTGTDAILSITNSNTTFGTGLGSRLEFGAAGGTPVAFISGAMAGPSFNNGGILTLESRAGFLGHINAVVDGSERLRIDPSGNVLVGGTLPSSPNITLGEDGQLTAKRINGAWEYYDESPSLSVGDKREFTIVFPANNSSGLFKFEFATGRNTSNSASVRQALVVYLRAFTDNSTSPGQVDSSFGEAEIYAVGGSMASNFAVASSGTGDGTFTVTYENTTGAGFLQLSTKITYIAARGGNVAITAANI